MVLYYLRRRDRRPGDRQRHKSRQQRLRYAGIGITAATVTGAYDTLIAGSGTDTLTSSGLFNSLVGGSGADTLLSSGQQDTLIAGSGSQTLTSIGADNTLIAGTAADLLTTSGAGDSCWWAMLLGSALNGAGGSGAIAVYTIDNVTVDLAAGTAGVNSAMVADTITGIANATVSGAGDTAMAGSGASILSSDGFSNTLIPVAVERIHFHRPAAATPFSEETELISFHRAGRRTR